MLIAIQLLYCSFENSVFHQDSIPQLMTFFLLITCLVYNVLILYGDIALWSLF